MYNKILEKVILPILDVFVGSSYMKSLKRWRTIDTYSEKELNKLQDASLRKILSLAVSKVPFYKKRNISEELNTHDWLQQFPILSKDMLRDNLDELLTETKTNLVKIISSGSSGVRTVVYMNQTDISSLRAGNTHWWEWAGYKIGGALLQTGITTERSWFKKIKDLIFNVTYINAFALTEKQLEEICRNLSKGNQKYILGYASSLNVIAEYALEKEYTIRLETVICLGDKLFSHYRMNIEKAFQCKVYETYGSSEGFLVASQYDLPYLYINTAQVYLEILDDNDKPVKDGEIGHAIVTRLDNRAMPLIRYRLGDLCVKLPKERYPEKRAFAYPLLEKVIGRTTDLVVLPDGKKLVVHSFTGVFEHFKEIKQFKVIQRSVEGIDIEFIPSNNFYKEVLILIENRLQEFIANESFKIYFKKVEHISATNSGKPQIIQSHII